METKKSFKERMAGIIRSRDARMLALVLLFLAVGAIVLAQDVTITTYYPAPFGVYSQLVTRTLGVGDTDGSGTYDGSDAPPIANDGEVWIAGDVGIGTRTPGDKLEVFDPSTSGDGGITIHRGRYARLNIISDNYWSGIEIRRDSAGVAGRPHIDFTNDLTTNFGIRVSAPTNDVLAVEGGSFNIGTTGTDTGGLLQVGGTTTQSNGIYVLRNTGSNCIRASVTDMASSTSGISASVAGTGNAFYGSSNAGYGARFDGGAGAIYAQGNIRVTALGLGGWGDMILCPVRRFWNSNIGDHLFTANPTEIANLVADANWADEGVAFYAFAPASW